MTDARQWDPERLGAFKDEILEHLYEMGYKDRIASSARYGNHVDEGDLMTFEFLPTHRIGIVGHLPLDKLADDDIFHVEAKQYAMSLAKSMNCREYETSPIISLIVTHQVYESEGYQSLRCETRFVVGHKGV